MPAMSEVQNEIACKALDLLMLLLAREDGADSKEGGGDGDGDSKRPERQTLVADVEDGMLSEMLAHVAFSRADAFSHAPAVCRERAMRVAGALVAGHPTNQYNLGEVSLMLLALARRLRSAWNAHGYALRVRDGARAIGRLIVRGLSGGF